MFLPLVAAEDASLEPLARVSSASSRKNVHRGMSTKTIKAELESAIADGRQFSSTEPGAPLYELPAEILQEFVCRDSDAAAANKRIWLTGVRIGRDLNLEAQLIGPRLLFERCTFEGGVDLFQAQAPDLSFVDCILRHGIRADHLELRWNFCVRGSEINGGLSLEDACIGGTFSAEDATITGGVDSSGDREEALRADNASIGGSFLADSLTAIGCISLGGAKFASNVSMVNADLDAGQVRKQPRTAFYCENSEIAGAMSCLEMSASGEVCLRGAKVGSLSLSEANLEGSCDSGGIRDASIKADGLVVHGGLYCLRGFSACGEIRLVNAVFGGPVRMEDAILRGRADNDMGGGPALNADEVECRAGLFLRDAKLSMGGVSLMGARVSGELSFDRAHVEATEGGKTGMAGVALALDGAQVEGSVFCDELFVKGFVRIIGSSVSGPVSFTHTPRSGA